MDTFEEYTYFEKQHGLISLYRLRLVSYLCLSCYLVYVAVNWNAFLKNLHSWHNFEGLFFYSLICLQMTTLHLYAESKKEDCTKLLFAYRN